jgi:hypothetical protein
MDPKNTTQAETEVDWPLDSKKSRKNMGSSRKNEIGIRLQG